MSNASSFVGEISRIYDSHLGPLFDWYAKDLADRLAALHPTAVLFLACGTGICAKALRTVMPGARIVATDLNPGMLDVARSKLSEAEVEFEVADAQSIPYSDSSFQAVACQFGLMFVPDKDAMTREAQRVLTAGGSLICSVWDALSENPLPRIAHELIQELCADDPPQFYLTPFGCHDKVELRSLFERNGFDDVRVDVVNASIAVEDPARLAHGMVYGTPAYLQLAARPDFDFVAFERELTTRIAASLLPDGTTPRQALLVSGRKNLAGATLLD